MTNLEPLWSASDARDSNIDSLEWKERDGWNYCPYCGEAVQAPALYCCEEHEEGRSMS